MLILAVGVLSPGLIDLAQGSSERLLLYFLSIQLISTTDAGAGQPVALSSPSAASSASRSASATMLVHPGG
jgi:hypothetical protein